jgi:2-keto-3-deoxy-L-rhamnonate aldolase RhmA
MLKTFYITNNPQVAVAVENAGVDRIFVDMEYIGKDERQKGLDTVKNHHTVQDVKNIKSVLSKAELLVRVNPIHQNSKSEIDQVIDAGADIIMLPMWKTTGEVEKFINFVGGRAKTILLLETEEARLCLDDVLNVRGIDEMYIGLNDLHLSQGKSFMFELLTDGTVDSIVEKIKCANIPFGIGGVGKVNSNNLLSAENILCEHYRLGSSQVILARAFLSVNDFDNIDDFAKEFKRSLEENKKYEQLLQTKEQGYFDAKHKETEKIIKQIIDSKR